LYEVVFSEQYFKFGDNISLDARQKISKKLEILKTDRQFRHLRFGIPYFVLEI